MMPRKISALLCLSAALFALASAASADAPPPKKPPPPPKGKPPAPPRWQPPAARNATGPLVASLSPLSLYTWPAGQIARGETMSVNSALILANRPAPANHWMELHVERTPGKFVKAAAVKTDAAGAATLQWKVGPQFPLGDHRWFVKFPGTKAHKPSQTAFYPFQVFNTSGSRVLYFGLAPNSLYINPVGGLLRRDTMNVTALLMLPATSLSRHDLELHVERTPGVFEKVATVKTNLDGLATLKWKPGPMFPAGEHRAYVRFAGNKHHTASQTNPLTFKVP
jgi:hypothetical protein